ncbi:MAG: GNAT family N-acetyltransferase [Deltaproteobacteria bacterium]|nr:GNAT family N-acetyltransferase [Deltaproteobacteria bacterium]
MTEADTVRIGAADPADADAVAALAAAALREPFGAEAIERARTEAGAVLLVARVASGGVAGFVAGQRVLDELHVFSLAVAPAWRRRGVASALLGAAVGDPPARTVLLEVRASNEGARRFYRALGFDEVGCRRGYYTDGEDARLLTRSAAARAGCEPRSGGDAA